MQKTRLSSKGQIILPKSIRDARAWEPGTEFTVETAGNGVLLRPATFFPNTCIEDVAGYLKSKRKAGTPDRTRQAIEAQVKRRHDRGRY